MMEYKEHLMQFLLTKNINLSQYDRKFISKLQFMIHKDNKVTTNQLALFDKLILKYSRQLTKADQSIDMLSKLPWKTNIVESSPLYTGANISLIGDTLHLRVPFNKKFIAEFKTLPNNPFEWDPVNKIYKAEFGSYGLRILTTILGTHFSTVEYSEELNTLLAKLNAYRNYIWDPTLVKVNGQLMVAGCNHVIGELIKDIDLNLNPSTLYKLSQMGIKIDPTLVKNNPKLVFSSEFLTVVDLDNLETVVDWINELDCPVIIGKGGTDLFRLAPTNSFSRIINAQRNTNLPAIVLQYHSSTPNIRRYFGQTAIGKCIIVKNSRPVDVK